MEVANDVFGVKYSKDYKKLVDAKRMPANIMQLTTVSRLFAMEHSKIATIWKKLSCQRI